MAIRQKGICGEQFGAWFQPDVSSAYYLKKPPLSSDYLWSSFRELPWVSSFSFRTFSKFAVISTADLCRCKFSRLQSVIEYLIILLGEVQG